MSLSSSCSSPSNLASPSYSSQSRSRRSSTPWSSRSSPSGDSGFQCTESDSAPPYWLDHQSSAASLSQLAGVPLPLAHSEDHQVDPWTRSRLQLSQAASPAPNPGIAPQQTSTMFDPSTPLVLHKSTSPQTSTSVPPSPSDNDLVAHDGFAFTSTSETLLELSDAASPVGTAKTPAGRPHEGPVPPPVYHLEPKFPPHPAYSAAVELKEPPLVLYVKLKGPWQKTEDEALVFWAIRLGTARWVDVAAKVGSRTGKQCRERWTNQLSPDIDHSPFRPDEDDLIIRMQAAMDGNRWREVAKFLPGRPENTIKNRFNSTVVQKRRAQLHSLEPPLIATPLLLNQKRRKHEAGDDTAFTYHPTKKGRKTSTGLSIMAPEQLYTQVETASDHNSVGTFPSTPVTPGFAQPSVLATHWSSNWEAPQHPPYALSSSYDYSQLAAYQAYRYGTDSGSLARRGYYPTQYGMMGGGTGGYLTPSSQHSVADYTPPSTFDTQTAYSDYSYISSSMSKARSGSSQELFQAADSSGFATQTQDTFSNFGNMSSMPVQSGNASMQLVAYRPSITHDGHASSRHGSRTNSPPPRWTSLASNVPSSNTTSQGGSGPLIGLGISMGSLDAAASASPHPHFTKQG